MLSAGNHFPDFSLPNQDGKITNLSDFAGHWLVVYFYPKRHTWMYDPRQGAHRDQGRL